MGGQEHGEEVGRLQYQPSSAFARERQCAAQCIDQAPVSGYAAGKLERASHTSKAKKEVSSKEENGASRAAAEKTEEATKPPKNKNNNDHALLTARSEHCLGQFYKDDYRVIRELLDHGACKHKECEEALRSILSRRRLDVLLDKLESETVNE